MKRFTSDEIDQLLDRPAQSRATAPLPEGFFEQMEKRILAATVEAENETLEAAASEANSTPFEAVSAPAPTVQESTEKPAGARRRFHLRPLWASAAAAAVLLVFGLTMKFLHSDNPGHDVATISSQTPAVGTADNTYADDDLYAFSPSADDDEIDELEEIYEADLFLADM